MKKLQILRKLEKYPAFGIRELKNITGKEEYARIIMHRLKKEGLICEIQRNRYTLKDNPLEFASSIVWPSYISCWSALRFYNMTEQLPNDIFVITPRKRKKSVIKFKSAKIIFIKAGQKLFFGYKKERYGDSEIFIAEKEKAIIDSALFKTASFSEIAGIVKENINEINTGILAEYLLKINDRALTKRFGFLLDSIGIDLHNKLKKAKGYNYVPLDYAMKKIGKKDKKWRVIVNAEP